MNLDTHTHQNGVDRDAVLDDALSDRESMVGHPSNSAASNEDYMDCTVLPFHATTRDFFEVASWLRDVLYDPVERRGFLRRTARCLAPLVALIMKERTNGGRQNNAGEALPLLLFLG